MKATLVNIASNAVTRIWVMGLGIILTPVYVRYLGIESYGLVGFYATLVGSLAILDLGLSNTLSRELSRSITLNKPVKEVNDLVFSLETIYWVVGLLLGLLVCLLSYFIGKFWVNSTALPFTVVRDAVLLMGIVLAFQWPQSIYSGGLLGLHKQIPFNIANIILTTVKSVGVLLVLMYISHSIIAFFLWQAVITIITMLVFKFLLWKYLPSSRERARFNVTEVKKVWRFAAGMTGISLATFALTQLDKIWLSKTLSLSDFGHYMLAWTVGTALLMITSIISATLLPKMNAIVASGSASSNELAVNKYSKFLASVTLPVGFLLVIFSKEILSIWIKNHEIVENINVPVKILTLGSLFNMFMHVPYWYLLARGNTRFTMIQNMVASILLIPLLFFFVKFFGLIGGCFVWFTVNLLYVLISIPLLHKLYLKESALQSYLKNYLPPVLISLAVYLPYTLLKIESLHHLLQAAIIMSALVLVYFLIVVLSEEFRNGFIIGFKKWQKTM